MERYWYIGLRVQLAYCLPYIVASGDDEDGDEDASDDDEDVSDSDEDASDAESAEDSDEEAPKKSHIPKGRRAGANLTRKQSTGARR